MLSIIINNFFFYTIIWVLCLIIFHFFFFYKIISLLIITGVLFFISGLLFAYLGAEFVGLTLILVYVGAILVLFLYVIMLVKPYVNNTRSVSDYKQLVLFFFFFIVICVWFSFLLFLLEDSLYFFDLANITDIYSATFDLKNFGLLLYSSRFFDLYILAFILLLGIFGILLLILKKVENRKIQDDLRQIMIKKYVNVF